MKIKSVLIKIHWILSGQFGIDVLVFLRSLRGFHIYLYDWIVFRKGYAGSMKIMPCLHDRYEEGGATKNEYFWQDLIVARWIHADNPEKHVDIGSRVDGFVAHVASFREVEVFDIRPITMHIPGVIFREVDFMDAKLLPSSSEGGYCDSLSCLHALEHFGLGRYGDPINPRGYIQGLENMASLLRSGGILYLSTPVGKERVEFNANWIFDPRTILKMATDNGLKLKRLTVFSHKSGIREMELLDSTFQELSVEPYSLGIFRLVPELCG